MKGILHETKDGLSFSMGITAIVIDYANEYKEKPEAFKRFLESFESPVSVMNEFYLMMVQQKQFEPIENLEDKQELWNEVKSMNCSKEKRIKIAKAIYSLKMILK